MNTPVPVESRLAALEAKALADENKVVAWFKAHWPHLVTWLGLAYGFLKHL